MTNMDQINLSWGISLAPIRGVTPSQTNGLKLRYSAPLFSLYVLTIASIFERESITPALLFRVFCVNFPPAWPVVVIGDLFVTAMSLMSLCRGRRYRCYNCGSIN